MKGKPYRMRIIIFLMFVVSEYKLDRIFNLHGHYTLWISISSSSSLVSLFILYLCEWNPFFGALEHIDMHQMFWLFFVSLNDLSYRSFVHKFNETFYVQCAGIRLCHRIINTTLLVMACLICEIIWNDSDSVIANIYQFKMKLNVFSWLLKFVSKCV